MACDTRILALPGRKEGSKKEEHFTHLIYLFWYCKRHRVSSVWRWRGQGAETCSLKPVVLLKLLGKESTCKAVSDGFNIFQRTTCFGYLKKKTRSQELMVPAISQLRRKHGFIVVVWLLCLGWVGGEAGSLEFLVSTGYMDSYLVWPLVGVWSRMYDYRTMEFLLWKSTRNCKTFNQNAMNKLVVVCLHRIHTFLQQRVTYLIKNLSK